MAESRSLDIARETEKRIDIFVKIRGITGESTDAKHQEWIEAIGLSWGVRQPSGIGSGAGAMGERADFDNLVVSKVVDKASPMLYRYCAQGTLVKDVRIELCEQAASHVNFLTILLRDTTVASARLTGRVTLEGAPRPVEEISFAYSRIEWQYVPISHAGEPGGMVMAAWDLETNTTG